MLIFSKKNVASPQKTSPVLAFSLSRNATVMERAWHCVTERGPELEYKKHVLNYVPIPYNGHLSTTVTFLCPQSGRCGVV